MFRTSLGIGFNLAKTKQLLNMRDSVLQRTETKFLGIEDLCTSMHRHRTQYRLQNFPRLVFSQIRIEAV